MHNNKVWLLLLGVIAATALFFSFRAGRDLWHYQRTDAEGWISEIKWSIVEEGRHYIPQASYTFQVNSVTYSGQEPLEIEWQRNVWSAEQRIKELSAYKWKVWYNSSDPMESTLDRSFPWRSVIYGILTVALSAYFIGLGLYVGRLHK